MVHSARARERAHRRHGVGRQRHDERDPPVSHEYGFAPAVSVLVDLEAPASRWKGRYPALVEAIIGAFAVLGLFFLVKTFFAKNPERAPAPVRKMIEHDARADARCVRMVEHGISYLLQRDPTASTKIVIAEMRDALRENDISNPTAFGLLTTDTVERLRREPVEKIDEKEISFLFDDDD